MKTKLLLLGVLGCSLSYSQTSEEQTNLIFEATPDHFEITPKLSDIDPYIDPPVGDKDVYTVPNKMRRNKFVNEENALPKGDDPVWQKQGNSHYNKAPLQNWEGLGNFAFPPDPSGAAGPNHYVQMVNSTYAVYSKTGSLLYGPTALGSLLGGGNDGDPIVMYDKAADRWFLSQFAQSGNKLIIAVSQTPDPTGAYYSYEYSLNSFPDYPKYAIWHDGYYVTANKSGEPCYVLERDKMLAGDQNARILGFTLPSIATPGFFSVLPAHAGSAMPPSGTPEYLFYFQDDGWGGVSQDHIKIWELSIDWNNTNNSAVSNPQQLNVSAFDSQFQSNWDDISQPNSSQKLDAVPGAFMYMAQYREINGYGAVVLNHTVDVNGSDHAGIRWYELRKSGSNAWSLAQEGTFAPDNQNRWMGSIAMDYQGNIGLAYNVSGSTVYPSIRYTGRYASDPTGQMTLNEEEVILGTSTQSGANRWGDYAHMTIDPIDDATFWYTGEYVAGSRKSRIFSFKIANDADNDVGVVSIDDPNNGILTGTETIAVTVKNFGTNDQSNFPVNYQVNGGGVVTQNYSGTLAAGATATHNFSTQANMSTPGNYSIKSYTGLTGDQYNTNDTTTRMIQHTFSDNVGVTTITSPDGNTFSSSETVTVTIENFGASAQNNIPVSYSVNGANTVTETFPGPLAAGANSSFSFLAGVDITSLGDYEIVAFTDLVSEMDRSNDTTSVTITHEICAPESDCSYGDGFTNFNLGTINNTTTCATNGYGDYTSMTTTLLQGSSNQLSLTSGYANQTASVWIDFNDNFSFEQNEMVVTNFNFGTSPATTQLSIPANASLGEHLMRARTNWNNQGTATIDDPCVTVQYGETEDYKVVIDVSNGISVLNENTPEIKIATLNDGVFEITILNYDKNVDIKVHNTIGQMVFSESSVNCLSGKTIDFSSEANGYYLIVVSNNEFKKLVKVSID